MPGPADVLGRDRHQHSGDPAASAALWRAEVLDVDAGTATIVVPGYNRQRDYERVPFMPRGAADIAPGDDAWVAFDDERNPVIVCWMHA